MCQSVPVCVYGSPHVYNMFSVAADLFGFPMFASLSVEHTKARSQEYTTNNVGRVSPPKTLKASGKRMDEGQECKIMSVGRKWGGYSCSSSRYFLCSWLSETHITIHSWIPGKEDDDVQLGCEWTSHGHCCPWEATAMARRPLEQHGNRWMETAMVFVRFG